MSTATIDTSGIDRLRSKLAKIANLNPVPVLETIADVMDEDNRRGVLAGLDKDSNPLRPVTYRPTKPGVKLTAEQRLGQKTRTKRGQHSAIGSGAQRAFNNLSSAEYRKLDGPPLAPRRQFSRVITNYSQRYGQIGAGKWEVIGAWVNVLSRKGRPFLHYHFNGEGRNPVRDLRGVREWGRNKIKSALKAWAIDQIRSSP